MTGPDAALPAGGVAATGDAVTLAPVSPEAARLRRLRMRSWRRGMRETDLLLGQFADAELARMEADDLALYEALLEENDQDLYAWIIAASAGRDAMPERFRPLITRIAHAAEARLEKFREPAASHGDQ